MGLQRKPRVEQLRDIRLVAADVAGLQREADIRHTGKILLGGRQPHEPLRESIPIGLRLRELQQIPYLVESLFSVVFGLKPGPTKAPALAIGSLIQLLPHEPYTVPFLPSTRTLAAIHFAGRITAVASTRRRTPLQKLAHTNSFACDPIRRSALGANPRSAILDASRPSALPHFPLGFAAEALRLRSSSMSRLTSVLRTAPLSRLRS